MRRVLPALVLLLAFFAPASARAASLPAPLTLHAGPWPTSHLQGLAVDLQGGYIYCSFTTLLVKYDFTGRLIGSIGGFTGHLGDLDFNPRDGRVYGSLEYKDDHAFYVAVIDVSRLDRVGLDASAADIFRTVYLPEVTADFAVDLDGDGRCDDRDAGSPDHRYGCSGIDGVSFGPAFGHTDGPALLTVAYGIYGHPARSDNDHQVLLQYDVSDWACYERPLVEAAPHRSGPSQVHGKYFVRTGNTTYGVQNLAYDPNLQRWFLGVYAGKKPAFPNYLLFAVEARTPPVVADLIGVPARTGSGFERGSLLSLAADGLRDPATGLRGWRQKADVGLQPLGHGLFYLAVNSGPKGHQTADLTLVRWTSDADHPFTPATAEEVRALAR